MALYRKKHKFKLKNGDTLIVNTQRNAEAHVRAVENYLSGMSLERSARNESMGAATLKRTLEENGYSVKQKPKKDETWNGWGDWVYPNRTWD